VAASKPVDGRRKDGAGQADEYLYCRGSMPGIEHNMNCTESLSLSENKGFDEQYRTIIIRALSCR
jgi:hypothetical protein